MKRLLVALGVASVVAGESVAAAKTVVHGIGGTLSAEGCKGEIVAYGEGWGGSATPANVLELPDERTGRAAWSMQGSKGLSVRCESTVRQEGDGLRVSATVTSEADARPECVAFAFNFDAAPLAGWTWSVTTDGAPAKTGVVPAQFKSLSLYSGTARAFALVAPNGVKAYEWTFPAGRAITWQDSRRWGPSLTLRIGARPKTFVKGTKVPIDFTWRARDGLRLAVAKRFVVQAGPDWIPLDYRKTIAAGSALDFSGMGFLDAPAGKHGWLKNVNGHFEFENAPGVVRKFYGVNLCGTANTPAHELADDFIQRLRRLGYNAIRLHHHERSITRNRLKEGHGFDPTGLDRLDYLVAKGISQGFYFTTDMFVSRSVAWEDVGLAERGKGLVDMQLYKALVAVWDPAFEDWKRFAEAFLTHVNPYTGRAYRDEPALPLISLINEGQLTMGWGRGCREEPIVDAAYRAWLAAKRAKDPKYRPEAPASSVGLNCYGATGAVMSEFMADVERKSAERMCAFLRGLGVKALLTNANCGPHTLPMNAVRAAAYDYTDDHFYVDHPRFLRERWRLPSKCDNGNPAKSAALPPLGCAFTRIAGQPMCITEWNFSGPGTYRGVGGILTGAFAAIQDWSGLWRFAYSHSEADLRDDGNAKPGYFNVGTDALGLLSDRASICLFLRGDLQPADRSFAFEADDVTLERSGTRAGFNAPKWRNAAWQARVAMTVPGAPVPPRTERLPVTRAYAADTAPFDDRPNPAFRLDRDAGTFTIDTPLTSGGFAPDGCLDCGRVAFAVRDAPATVWASSVDAQAKDIVRARRLLVFHLTDVQADGNVYLDETRRVILKWGKAPSVVRRGEAEVALRLDAPDAYEVWALRTDGTRLERLPATVAGNRLKFRASVAGPEGARMVYEVIRK